MTEDKAMGLIAAAAADVLQTHVKRHVVNDVDATAVVILLTV